MELKFEPRCIWHQIYAFNHNTVAFVHGCQGLRPNVWLPKIRGPQEQLAPWVMSLFWNGADTAAWLQISWWQKTNPCFQGLSNTSQLPARALTFFSFLFFEFEEKCKEYQVLVHQAPGKYLSLVLKIKKVIFQRSKEEMPIGMSSFQCYLSFLTRNVLW